MRDQWLLVLARLFLSAVFVRSGISHGLEFAGTQGAIASKGVPTALAAVMAVAAIILLLGGGLSILLGVKTRVGAIALLIFLIPATVLFHLNLADRAEEIQFLKNIGLMGGLLLLVQVGPGAFSIDGSRRTSGPSRR